MAQAYARESGAAWISGLFKNRSATRISERLKFTLMLSTAEAMVLCPFGAMLGHSVSNFRSKKKQAL
jgi:hypothetical protein